MTKEIIQNWENRVIELASKGKLYDYAFNMMMSETNRYLSNLKAPLDLSKSLRDKPLRNW